MHFYTAGKSTVIPQKETLIGQVAAGAWVGSCGPGEDIR